MHRASDPTQCSRYTTHRLSTCANILLYAHRERSDLRGVSRVWGIKPLPQRLRVKYAGVIMNFTLVFGMTQPGREPTTYCVRSGHANLYGNKHSRRVSSVSPFTYKITNLHVASPS